MDWFVLEFGDGESDIDRLWLVGPFPTVADANSWGDEFAGDIRWQTIGLTDSSTPLAVIEPDLATARLQAGHR